MTFLLGLGVEFGDNNQPNVGVTGKVLAAPFSNSFVVGVGGTYFPGRRSNSASMSAAAFAAMAWLPWAAMTS